MNEAKWLTCNDPSPLLEMLEGKVSKRKLRLFACACVRRVFHLLTDERSRTLVVMMEKYADYHDVVAQSNVRRPFIPATEVNHTIAGAFKVIEGHTVSEPDFFVPHAAVSLSVKSPSDAIEGVFRFLKGHISSKDQADLLRHIIGNPFRLGLIKTDDALIMGFFRRKFGKSSRSFVIPKLWPSTITSLADALYNGEDCHYALADALMEAGHVELAEHFQERDHPKGCWAVDLILGNQ